MAHTIKEKQQLLARLRRIRGQIEAMEHALEEERGCEVIMQQIASVRGAIAGFMAEVVEDHVRTHLVDTTSFPKALDQEAIEQLIAVIRTYLK
jgi:Uncharacterized protein conserved in bacteria